MESPSLGALGKGFYTVAEAERLTRVHRSTIRRWLKGYEFGPKDGRRSSPPVWQSEYSDLEVGLALGFRDLIEVRFVAAFREHGVAWGTLRLSATRAAEMIENSHPFSTRRFKTDGRRIFADFAESTGDPKLIELARGQHAFRQAIAPSLYAGLEWSRDDDAVRWWPIPGRKIVVIDPRRSFGRPIVNTGSVPTAILASAVQAEESIERVAALYEISTGSVREALAFEESLAA